MASIPDGKPLTGKPDAGDPPVRFGGRGKVNPLSLPLYIQRRFATIRIFAHYKRRRSTSFISVRNRGECFISCLAQQAAGFGGNLPAVKYYTFA